jgi:acyl carrier protein
MTSQKAPVEKIREMVLEIVADHMGRPAPTLLATNSIQEDLGADSLDKMELVMTVEELFGISIADECTAGILTIDDIVEAIASTSLEASQLAVVERTWRMVSRQA